MNILIWLLVLAWCAANAYVRVRRIGTLNPITTDISTYITGPDALIERAGFGAMALACVLLAITYWADPVAFALFIAAAVALCAVVWTYIEAERSPADDAKWMPWHVRAAGASYILLAAAEWRVSGGIFALHAGMPHVSIVWPALAIVVAWIVHRVAPNWSAGEEMCTAIPLMLWVLV